MPLPAAAENAFTGGPKIPASRIAPLPTPDTEQRQGYGQQVRDGGIVTVVSATLQAHVAGH